MTLVISIFVILFALAIGSFLNVCIARLPGHRSIVRPGSACPSCGAQIRFYDNLPLLSWAVLRGRCRDCRWRIPWRYPAVEAATACLLLLCYLRFGLTLYAAGIAVLCFLLLGLAAMDAETMLLPDAFTLPGILLGIVWSGSLPAATLPGHLLRLGQSIFWAVCAALLILLIRWTYYFFRRVEGMGMGDVKLFALIAAWLGPGLTLLTLVLGTFTAAVFGLALLARRPSLDGRSTRLPFGSFLCAAALYAAFAGAPIIHWYTGFFR